MTIKYVYLTLICSSFIAGSENLCRADEFVKVKGQNSNTEQLSEDVKWVTPKDNSPTELQPTESVESIPQQEEKCPETPQKKEENPTPANPVAPIVAAPVQAPIPTQITEKKNSPNSVRGEVQVINPQKKFVIIEFKNKNIPSIGSKLGVYRLDTFVGSLQLTQPIKTPFASADIITGNVQLGDIVR